MVEPDKDDPGCRGCRVLTQTLRARTNPFNGRRRNVGVGRRDGGSGIWGGGGEGAEKRALF